MSIKIKILSVLAVVSLLGCTGNSETENFLPSSDFKRFSGVVNNASVKGISVGLIRIGKHGQFAVNDENQVDAIIKSSDDYGRFGFSVDIKYIGPYVLSAVTPEYEDESDAAKSSCQLAAGCSVKEDESPIPFGEYFSLDSNKQWSAAIEFVSDGQFVVINPITEMAKVLGYTIYISDGVEVDLNDPSKPAANYHSNHGILKGNTQTASLVGLSDILSIEPADLTLLHTLNTTISSDIKASIRYGALLAAWQKLELDHDKGLLSGDPTFQQSVIKEYLANQGQLYQSVASDDTRFTLKKWYQAARKNLMEVRTYYNGLGRSIPAEVGSVISDFEDEISGFSVNEGKLTKAVPSKNQQYEDDYTDAVTKTKAMVNYLSNLHANFATEEYRKSIKASSDLITAETRRLAPKLDIIFKKLLSIQQYYISCAHNNCDVQNEWHGAGSLYNENTKVLKIASTLSSDLEVGQELVFDEITPVGSTESNVHDLILSGSFEYEGLILELSDYDLDDESSLKNSIRFSFPKALAQLPLPPAEIVGGKGMTVDEDLVPDYIEMVLPDFKLYDLNNVGEDKEFKISGSLTALMFANTDAGDLLKDDKEKLGKRYNLSSVKGTLKLTGGNQVEVGGSGEFRDNALFFIDASSSESVVSVEDFTSYFPDVKYPTFESFFKPRKGYDVGAISPFPLVVSRTGEMTFPFLDSDGVSSETEQIKVAYLELDYEVGGLERYIVYPKLEGEDEYWGLICTAQPGDEDDLIAAGDGYTKTETDSEGKEYQRSLLSCPFRDKYSGEATVDDFANQVYKLNKDLFNLREYNGHGAYRIDYPLDSDDKLTSFSENKESHFGVMEKPIVLGVSNMRLQFKPSLVNPSISGYLPESILDISLVWRTHEEIDINAFLAFDTERVINNPNGSGLPYLAVGSDSESYSIAYRTDGEGNEMGEYAMAWRGVKFVDGEPGSTVMQRTDIENEKEGVFAGIGSNVSYGGKVDLSDKKCGFFGRTNDKTIAAGECDAIAYFTFRGLVTGSLREERDGVYVIRYIDGSWQVLGAN